MWGLFDSALIPTLLEFVLCVNYSNEGCNNAGSSLKTPPLRLASTGPMSKHLSSKLSILPNAPQKGVSYYVIATHKIINF